MHSLAANPGCIRPGPLCHVITLALHTRCATSELLRRLVEAEPLRQFYETAMASMAGRSTARTRHREWRLARLDDMAVRAGSFHETIRVPAEAGAIAAWAGSPGLKAGGNGTAKPV